MAPLPTSRSSRPVLSPPAFAPPATITDQERERQKAIDDWTASYKKQAELLCLLWQQSFPPNDASISFSSDSYYPKLPRPTMHCHIGGFSTDLTRSGPQVVDDLIDQVNGLVAFLERYKSNIERQRQLLPGSLDPIPDYQGDAPEYPIEHAERDAWGALQDEVDVLNEWLPEGIDVSATMERGGQQLDISVQCDFELGVENFEAEFVKDFREWAQFVEAIFTVEAPKETK